MHDELERILRDNAIRSVYQPVVDLDSRRPVAYEALARGPEGSPLERPDRLFAAATEADRLGELDRRCLELALERAGARGIAAPLTLFLNLEPHTISPAWAEQLPDVGLPVTIELTERALLTRPADLLRTVAVARRRGWAVALDDVGADSRSLAMLPIVQPDIVKLDLRLVQDRPSNATAAIATAVQAEAERSDMHVLAEGIETEEQLELARSLGADLGQGWLFGRPSEWVDDASEAGPALSRRSDPEPVDGCTPAQLLPPGPGMRMATKPLLHRMSQHLERQAASAGETAMVLGTFQHARYFTPDTRVRYEQLARMTALVAAFGAEMSTEPGQGVRGGGLEDDALAREWDVVVISPHFAAALVAEDRGDTGPESGRRFDFVVTYRRHTVERLARALLLRIWPELGGEER